jgi:hypothetical protein
LETLRACFNPARQTFSPLPRNGGAGCRCAIMRQRQVVDVAALHHLGDSLDPLPGRDREMDAKGRYVRMLDD